MAGLALSVGSLVALLLTHTVGIAGFTEATLSTDQIVAIVTEVGAAAGFGWLLTRSR